MLLHRAKLIHQNVKCNREKKKRLASNYVLRDQNPVYVWFDELPLIDTDDIVHWTKLYEKHIVFIILYFNFTIHKL